MRCIIGLFRYKFLVVGHTSSTGKAKHNLELSQKRADAINEALSTTLAVSLDRPFSIGAAEGRRSTLARPRQPTTVVFD